MKLPTCMEQGQTEPMSLLKVQVGRLAKSRLKQKEGYG